MKAAAESLVNGVHPEDAGRGRVHRRPRAAGDGVVHAPMVLRRQDLRQASLLAGEAEAAFRREGSQSSDCRKRAWARFLQNLAAPWCSRMETGSSRFVFFPNFCGAKTAVLAKIFFRRKKTSDATGEPPTLGCVGCSRSSVESCWSTSTLPRRDALTAAVRRTSPKRRGETPHCTAPPTWYNRVAWLSTRVETER